MGSVFVPADPLSTSRYNRQLLIPAIGLKGQKLISQAKVLIIGLGGLGSPASLYLAGSGLHTLGLLDHDVVEVSNLHRQIVHTEASVRGNVQKPMTKVASAVKGCRELNSEVNYVAHEVQLNGANALQIIGEYDLVLDCTDNPATRYLINDCCVVLQKLLVSGAAQRLEGQVVVLNYPIIESSISTGVTETKEMARGPCYRCVFPIPPSPDMVKGCSEIGILGPVVGAIGTLMASEALRLICQPREARKPTMLLYNAWSIDPKGLFRVLNLRGQRNDCVSCGSDSVLRGKGKIKINAQMIRESLMNYEAFCGKVEDVRILEEQARISARAFLGAVSDDQVFRGVIVDVREPYEIELGPKLRGSVNIPISEWHRMSIQPEHEMMQRLPEQLQHLGEQSVYFVCQQGNDSQTAAKKFIDMTKLKNESGSQPKISTRWIGDVRGGLSAIESLVNS